MSLAGTSIESLTDNLGALKLNSEIEEVISKVTAALKTIREMKRATVLYAPTQDVINLQIKAYQNKLTACSNNLVLSLQELTNYLVFLIENIKNRVDLRGYAESAAKTLSTHCMTTVDPTTKKQLFACYQFLRDTVKTLPNPKADVDKITSKTYKDFAELRDDFAQIEFTAELIDLLTQAEKNSRASGKQINPMATASSKLENISEYSPLAMKNIIAIDENTQKAISYIEQQIRINFYLLKYSFNCDFYHIPIICCRDMYELFVILNQYKDESGFILEKEALQKYQFYNAMFDFMSNDFVSAIIKLNARKEMHQRALKHILFANLILQSVSYIQLLFDSTITSLSTYNEQQLKNIRNEINAKITIIEKRLKIYKAIKTKTPVRGDLLSELESSCDNSVKRLNYIREKVSELTPPIVHSIENQSLLTVNSNVSQLLTRILKLTPTKPNDIQALLQDPDNNYTDEFQSQIIEIMKISIFKDNDSYFYSALYNDADNHKPTVNLTQLKINLAHFILFNLSNKIEPKLRFQLTFHLVSKLCDHIRRTFLSFKQLPLGSYLQVINDTYEITKNGSDEFVKIYNHEKLTENYSPEALIRYLLNITIIYHQYLIAIQSIVYSRQPEEKILLITDKLSSVTEFLILESNSMRNLISEELYDELNHVVSGIKSQIEIKIKLLAQRVKKNKNIALPTTSSSSIELVNDSTDSDNEVEISGAEPSIHTAPSRPLYKDDTHGWINPREKRPKRAAKKYVISFTPEESIYDYQIRHNLKNFLPELVVKVLHTLNLNGYHAFITGGMVRDLLLKRPYHDIDIVTNCSSSELLRLLGDVCYASAHRSNLFHIDGLRSDITCLDMPKLLSEANVVNMHPSLYFMKCVAEKSDLTINCFFINAQGKIFDPLRHIKTLSDKSLILTQPAEISFIDDPQRILRLFLISVRTGKAIADTDMLTIKQNIEKILSIPFGVYLTCLKRLFLQGNAARTFLLLHKHNLFTSLFFSHGQVHRNIIYTGSEWLAYFSKIDQIELDCKPSPFEPLAYCLFKLYSSTPLFFESHFKGSRTYHDINRLNHALEAITLREMAVAVPPNYLPAYHQAPCSSLDPIPTQTKTPLPRLM